MQSPTLADRMQVMAQQIPPQLHKKMPRDARTALHKARLRQPMTDGEQHVVAVMWAKVS